MIAMSIPCLPGLARVALRACSKTLQLLACIWLAACAGSALAACPAQPPRVRVTDTAGLLGGKASAIDARLRAYQQASGHQLFVLVLPSLDGASIEECAVSVFKDWKLGRKGIDDGVLLLVAAKERKIRIEVGYGLEGTLTDVQSSRIIREVMRPLFASGDYGGGVEQGLGAIIGVLGAGDPVAQPAQPGPPAASPASPADPGTGPGTAIFLVFVVVIVLLLTQVTGVLGLAFVMLFAGAFALKAFPGVRGFLLTAAIGAAWCLLRWRLIRTNVRRYHLEDSQNRMNTWIWYFCAFGFAAPPRPHTGARPIDSSSDDGGFSFSFGGGGDSDSGSDSGDSDSSSDSGGGSGGGGASDDY